ncbi:MAG: Phosphatidylinositol phosphate synthase @ Archaetidylinositol phosphate synthase [uncultured Frankineae bacterium]|uniref:Phosphatidylinositol phosphate synthase n=1 Tax=uncultured Frankineae bacterium TaxID=437475 RepID=A0A6J4LH05_9ACTN|nr:MAG: Phosphatidylinositol phosphate synthase @ Archaetidylinositol phosphate synthase [uncultured Frankineae bacterium]
MLSLRVRPALARVVDPVAGALLRAGVSPDAVTVVGTLGVVSGALAFFPRGMLFVGTMVVTAFVLTDMLDGAMARRLERRSLFGAWLDSTCDRLADAAVFSGLVLWFVGDGDDRLLAGVALFCLVAGSLVSYAKARAEGLGLRCDVGFAERAERLIIVLVGAGLSGLGVSWALPVGLWALAAASAVTVVQRLLEVRRQAAAAVR